MYNVEVRAESVYSHSHPEYAEIGNPRGEVYRTSWFVQVTHEHGERWVTGDFAWEEEAQSHAELVREALDCGLEPEDFPEHFSGVEPAYGSDAYVEGDYEYHRAQREREDFLMGL